MFGSRWNQTSEQGNGGDEHEAAYFDGGNVLWAGVFGERGKVGRGNELVYYSEEVSQEDYCEFPPQRVSQDALQGFQSFQHLGNLADSEQGGRYDTSRGTGNGGGQ